MKHRIAQSVRVNLAEQAKGGASLHPISSPDPKVVAALEKHYGPNRSSSTPEPRRGNPDSIRKDLGSNLDDSLFETGGSKRHIAPMPTQGMSILHAERHQRQEVTRRHFEEEKNRFEGARIAEMDRMNEEFEALSHRLVQLRNKNEDLELRRGNNGETEPLRHNEGRTGTYGKPVRSSTECLAATY